MILGLDVCTDKWVESGSPCDISCHRLVDTPFVGSLHIYIIYHPTEIGGSFATTSLQHRRTVSRIRFMSSIHVNSYFEFCKNQVLEAHHTHIYIIFNIYIYMTKNNEDHQQVLFLFSISLVETSGLGYRMCEDQMSPKCATRLELSACHQALTI